MKQLTAWSLFLLVGSIFPVACATATSTPDEDDGKTPETGGESAGGAATSSGGKNTEPSGSGGESLASGGSDTGGDQPGGASNGGPIDDDCKDGEISSCAVHSPLYPAGTASCTDGVWNILECKKCEPSAVVPCAEVVPTRPVGSVTCNADGSDFTENPKTVCAICTPGEETDCTNPGNTTGNIAGKVTCGADSTFDFSSCHLCEAGITEVACIKIVGTGRVYSAGMAICDATGDAYDDVNCDWCGDGALQEPAEECDPALADSTTCEALGWDGDTSPVECMVGNECEWNRRSCSRCPGPECITGKCDSAGGGCDGRECQGSCEFNCRRGQICDDVVCGNGATCIFGCRQEQAPSPGGCTSVSCDPHSNCTLDCTDGGQCNGTVCEVGSTCAASCRNGSCDEFICEEASCDLNCEDGSCEDSVCQGSECDFKCRGGSCDGSACLTGSSCDFSCNDGSCVGLDCTDSTCSIHCNNTGSVCSTLSRFVCEAGETCVFDCENGGDCSGVQATCVDGSTCEINCQNNGPGCADVVCEAGADCTLDCNNATCPSVVLAE